MPSRLFARASKSVVEHGRDPFVIGLAVKLEAETRAHVEHRDVRRQDVSDDGGDALFTTRFDQRPEKLGSYTPSVRLVGDEQREFTRADRSGAHEVSDTQDRAGR